MKLCLFLLALLALCSTANVTNKLWPRPANYTYTPEGQNFTVSPCDIKYVAEGAGQTYVEELINLYLIQVFHCSKIQ